MATAIPNQSIVSVTLELSYDEARTLCTILGSWVVGPNGEDAPRNHTDAIWSALITAGVESDRTVLNTRGDIYLERLSHV